MTVVSSDNTIADELAKKNNGAIVAAEIELKVRGISVYDRFVKVWTVLSDDYNGGEFKCSVILCDINSRKRVKDIRKMERMSMKTIINQ